MHKLAQKRIRKSWEAAHPDYDLTYVWGYDLNEIPRAENMIEANPQAKHEFPLIEKNYIKKRFTDCLKELLILNGRSCMNLDILTTTA